MATPYEVLSEAYEQLGMRQFSSIAVEASSKLCAADMCSYFEVDLAGRTIAANSKLEFASSRTMGARAARSVVNDDVIPYWHRARVGRACRIEDFTTRAEFQDTRVYAELLEPLGVTQLTIMTLRVSDETRVACVGLARERKPFADAEMDELNRFAPQMVRAQQIAQLLEHGRRGSPWAIRGIEWVQLEHMVLAPDGFLRESSERAAGWMREFHGPAPRYDCTLPASVWAMVRRSVTAPLRNTIEPAELDGARLLLVAVPEPSGDITLLLERRTPLTNHELQRALGLAEKQSEIVRELLEFEELEIPDIARQTGRNKLTLQTQTKTVLDRLGVKRRTQLRQAVEDRLARWHALVRSN